MTHLSPENYNYYKRLCPWNLLIAAMVVNGILFDESINPMENSQKIQAIFKVSLSAFKNGKLPCFEDDETIISLTSYQKRFFSDFYRDDDVYDFGYLKCFNPISYVKWLTEDRIVKIPYELMLTDKKDGWADPPKAIWHTNLPLAKDDRQNIFREYVQYPFWNSTEAISILFGYDPKNTNFEKDFFNKRKIAFEALNRTIEIKSFGVEVTNNDQLSPQLEKDDSERKQVEDELHESEIKLQSLFDHSPDAIGVSCNGLCVKVNDAFAKMFGYALDKLLSYSVSEI